MTKPTLIFCGSFLEYSALILQALLKSQVFELRAVITTPPQPTGKDKKLVKTPVHKLAESASVPVFTPGVLDEAAITEIENNVGKPDLLVTAGYGKLLPSTWLSWPAKGALNLHFSLLPKYRGANPAEWALLLDEKETGITLIEMSPQFDTGTMIAAARLAITAVDTRETLYQQLYALGADTLESMLAAYLKLETLGQNVISQQDIQVFTPPQPQPPSPTPFASRFSRDEAFVSWSALQAVMRGQLSDIKEFSPFLQKALAAKSLPADARFVERAIRALSGFPTLWTLVPTVKGEKRMKLLSAHLDPQAPTKLVLDQVHLEGKAPARWAEIKNSVG